MKKSKNRRILELDILRSIACLMIVPVLHIQIYTWDFLPPYLDLIVKTGGLGLFIFLSGFCIHLSTPRVGSIKAVKEFLAKRVLRIFPLYWLVLPFFIACVYLETSDLSLFSLVSHYLGLQLVFSPEHFEPAFTIWYIGLVVIYYIVYIGMTAFGDSTKRIVIASVAMFIMFLALRETFGLFERRFFLWYFVFVAGVLFSKYREGLLAYLDRPLLPNLMAAYIMLFTMYFAFYSDHSAFGTPMYGDGGALNVVDAGFELLLINAMIITFVLAALTAAKLVRDRIPRNMEGAIVKFSYASYAIYLLHRPFYTLVGGVEMYVMDASMAEAWYVMFLSVPLLFIIGYEVQSRTDRGFPKLVDRIAHLPIPSFDFQRFVRKERQRIRPTGIEYLRDANMAYYNR
jgi:peptidoglycan/LPS O-acetylase OafA/YrhL